MQSDFRSKRKRERDDELILEKYILAVVTTAPGKTPSAGAPIFACDTKKEMDFIAANLEAILDGIAHLLTEEIYIIVKH